MDLESEKRSRVAGVDKLVADPTDAPDSRDGAGSLAPLRSGRISAQTHARGAGGKTGLTTIAACALIALVITLALGHDPHLERGPEAAE